MRVTIIGTGNMGRGIATRALAGGHDVEIVDRDAPAARSLADELEGTATALEPGVEIGGDDADAKQTVSQLAADGGLRPIDAGPLARAQQLEQVGFLHIALQEPLGLGFGSALKLHP